MHISRYQIATSIAILFHGIGLTGLLFTGNDFFIRATPVNLLLMLLLIFYTQKKITAGFLIFIFLTFCLGFFAELIGTHTGLLFGDYKYGDSLGPAINSVPIIIGVNWIIVIYCVGTSVNLVLNKLVDTLQIEPTTPKPVVRFLSIIVDGATLATAFDWLIEPVAIKLGFWQWQSTNVPLLNYICWFLLSILFLSCFQYLRFDKSNKFALNLLLIQAMFFLLLRTFL